MAPLMTRTPSKPKTASRKPAERKGPSPEEALTNDLIALMETGVAPWRRPWSYQSSLNHCNVITGRPYRGSNPLLLELGMAMRGAALPFWCGFAEAKKLGIFPRKGSRAVRIIRPQLNAREEEGDNGETVLRSWTSYKPVCVFNVADLEGDALQGLIDARLPKATDDLAPADPYPHAAEVLGSWEVEVTRGGDRACYYPGADRIQLPKASAFVSPGEHYATWAHEAIHSTGHESRLKRPLGGGFGSPSYAREELVAELGSVLVGQRLQIGCELTNHAAYLQSWVDVLKESPTVLLRIVSDARKAVDLICPEPSDSEAPPSTPSLNPTP
jgi:antirestriction protein ArdC